MADRLMLLRDGEPIAVPIATVYPERGLIGEIKAYAGFALPTGFLWADGSLVSAITYPELAGAIGAMAGYGGAAAYTAQTFSGSDVVQTSADHDLAVGDVIFYRYGYTFSDFNIPLGFSQIHGPGITGYPWLPQFVVDVPSLSTIKLSFTKDGSAGVAAVALAAGHVNRSFNLPDLRDRVPVGRNNMGGSNAGVVPQYDLEVLSSKFGAGLHTLTSAQSGLPAHTHTYTGGNSVNRTNTGVATGGVGGSVTGTNAAQNAVQSHNNVQPVTVCNFIIRAT